MSKAKIKWVLDNEVGATPTVTDMLQACEEILSDDAEMESYLQETDVRLNRIPKVRELINKTGNS